MTDSSSGYQQFFAEMKRRRVFRVMAVYGVVAFGLIEAADIMVPRMALPDWTVTFVVGLALLGFPIAIVLAWAFDLTPEGVQRTGEAAPGELGAIIAAPASTLLACRLARARRHECTARRSVVRREAGWPRGGHRSNQWPRCGIHRGAAVHGYVT